MAARADFQRAVDQFADWRWRLSNLYYITDKDGRKAQFQMNWAQEALFNEMHFQNVILKARQLGFTTFIQLFMLDACLFNSNIRAGTIAHKLDDAKTIFRDKVKYPYDNLPDVLRAKLAVAKDSADELMFSNNSSIRVGTSLRSGTLQYLHVSEYGKLCAQFPEKAREVRTGALNTIQAGQVVFIESTAEGQEGHFFEICENAQASNRMGASLTPLDFKFHFFPWWKAPEYRLVSADVVIDAHTARYFDDLAKDGIRLDADQKAWYVKKAATQLGDMKREFPSTPKEAFEASVEGAILGEQIEAAEREGRIGTFPAVTGVPVQSFWDIGRRDYTSIWYAQIFEGPRVRLVHFYQNCLNGMPHYAAYQKKLYDERGWVHGDDFFPHDAKVAEWGSDKSRIEQLIKANFHARLQRELDLHDGINAMRAIMPICEFDQAECAEGIKMLKAYRWEWDDIRGAWKTDKPRHDMASHGSDAMRGLAVSYRDVVPTIPRAPGRTVETPRGPVFIPDVVKKEPTLNELWELREMDGGGSRRI